MSSYPMNYSCQVPPPPPKSIAISRSAWEMKLRIHIHFQGLNKSREGKRNEDGKNITSQCYITKLNKPRGTKGRQQQSGIT